MGNCLRLFRRSPGEYEVYSGSGSTQAMNEEKMVGTWRQTNIVGLRDRGLKELPSSVASVGAEAKVLDVSNNKLTAWPSQLSSLINLQRLILASNSITDITGSTLPALANSLKILVLDGNAISSLPDEIGLLVHLEKLSIKSNNLTQLNPCVGKLKALQWLNVSKNKLTDLPPDLSSCDSLEELDASDNVVTSIPPDLGKLQKLKSLNLDNNKISQVPPPVFLECLALQTLSLHGCPIVPNTIQETEGYQVFEQRRRQKYNKALLGGVLLGPRGMDEGIDRQTKQ